MAGVDLARRGAFLLRLVVEEGPSAARCPVRNDAGLVVAQLFSYGQGGRDGIGLRGADPNLR
jgi:hypothetical protein